jgi:hypothetical protein
MSAPITEAHRKLACDVLLDGVISAAQWIADSEAEAVQTAMLREYGNLCATNEGLAKERDQLRAEITRLDAEKPWLKEANATNADLRAEVERLGRATTNGQVNWMQESDRQNARAERAEAEMTFQQERNSRLFEQRDAAVAAQEKAEAELAAERAIVSRIWVQLGSPTYAQLKGRSIYCLIDEMKAELATERARLDWLEDHGWVTGEPCGRAAIDAAMKEGK